MRLLLDTHLSRTTPDVQQLIALQRKVGEIIGQGELICAATGDAANLTSLDQLEGAPPR